MKKQIIISMSFMLMIFTITAPSFIPLNQAFADGKFSVDVKINLDKLNHPDKLKVVASSNGENENKILDR